MTNLGYKTSKAFSGKEALDLISNKYFDVPYPVEWHYKQVQHYDIGNLIEACSRNMRKRIRLLRSLKH